MTEDEDLDLAVSLVTLKGASIPIGGVTSGFSRGWFSPARNPRTSWEHLASPGGFRDVAPSGEIADPSGLPCGPPNEAAMHSTHPEMGHGLRCRRTMFTKQVSRPVDSLDPDHGRGGGAGRANSRKDVITGSDPRFCALYGRTTPLASNDREVLCPSGHRGSGERGRPCDSLSAGRPEPPSFPNEVPELRRRRRASTLTRRVRLPGWLAPPDLAARRPHQFFTPRDRPVAGG